MKKCNYIIYFVLLIVGVSISFLFNGSDEYVALSTYGDLSTNKVYNVGDFIYLDQYKPVKAGYVFKGWTKTGNCNEIIHYDVIKAGVTYKACYVKAGSNNNSKTNAKSAFVLQGGILKSSDANIGSTVDLNKVVVTRSGYRFAGWYTAASGGSKVTGVKKLDKVIYAHWTPYRLTIYYNANGGTWCGKSGSGFSVNSKGNALYNRAIYSVIRNYGTVISDKYGLTNYDNNIAVCFKKKGYLALSGGEWNTKSNGSGVSFNHNNTKLTAYDVAKGAGCDLTSRDCEVTLYVNWKSTAVSSQLSVTLNANGGTINNKSIQNVGVAKNSSINLNNYVPVRSGYKFDGWYNRITGGSKVNSVKVSTNITYYAHWVQDTVPIKLNQSNLVLKINDTYLLKATINNTNSTVKWTSSNTSVAVVDANGKVTAKKNGTATITASLSNNSNVKATTMVTVGTNTAKPVIKISKSSLSLKSGDSYLLSTTVTGATNDVKWTSSNTDVAVVDANGKVRARKNGTATITATLSSNSSVKVESKVTVRKIKVLFVGNSFTYVTGSASNPYIPSQVVQMAAKDNLYMEFVSTLKGGATLNDLWGNSTFRNKINSSYDYAILQPRSSTFIVGHKNYVEPSKQLNAAVNMASALRSKNSNVKILLRRVWTYNNMMSSFKDVYNGITNIGNRIGNVTFIDDGNAFYDVLNNYKSLSIYQSDHYHQNTNGAYLASLCIYSNLFNKNPKDVNYVSSGVQNASTLKNIAYNNCYNSVNYYNVNNKVNVSLNANGGSVNSKNILNVGINKNGSINLNNYVPVRTGYVFNGWYTNSAGGSKVSGSQKISKNINYYAHWTAKTISVNFYRSTSSSDTTLVTQKFTYGKSGQKFGSTGFSRSGYTLVGWSLTRGGAQNYSILNGVGNAWINMNYPSINVYAVWKKNVDTSSFGSGYRNASSVSIKYNVKDSGGRCGGSKCASIATVKYANGKTINYYMGAQAQKGVEASRSCRINAFMDATNAVTNGKISSYQLYKFLKSKGYKAAAANLNSDTFSLAANKYGVSNKIRIYHSELDNNSAATVIKKALDNGQPVMVFVANSKCSDLASNYHALLLLGYDSNGKVVFQDSGNKATMKGYKERTVAEMSKCLVPDSIARTYYKVIVFSF